MGKELDVINDLLGRLDGSELLNESTLYEPAAELKALMSASIPIAAIDKLDKAKEALIKELQSGISEENKRKVSQLCKNVFNIIDNEIGNKFSDIRSKCEAIIEVINEKM
jgi:hypothetical protein